MYRKVLNASVASLLIELGFDCADNMALETLTEMLQSCKYFNVKCEVGLTSHS